MRGSRVQESYANRRCTLRARVDDEILKAYDYACTSDDESVENCNKGVEHKVLVLLTLSEGKLF